ncbi:30S ribosomal protein S6 [Propioniciclava sp. MC1683]|uniref:30S ribosomal protein S6 n=1 Tax=Propioniciclava sp. MC1683 TaxID=2760309 RepID=UPI001600CACC|nr:30S ribosomal protein S6 [Propioniciclava sp. MC1683]MBB1502350.1 30S ribosomal protein S6 [Propioniciclava sp. MC1683]
MRNYEIMVIVSPDVDDRQVQGVVEKPFEAFKAAGGTVDNVDTWGRRRLAYDIQKKSEGIYVVLNVTAEPAVVKELDRQYTLNEQIMRTKVIRPDLHH